MELLARLNTLKPVGETNWPKSAKGLGDALRRLSPALRTVGYVCKTSQKHGGTITWSISASSNKVSPTSPASPASPAEVLDLRKFSCEPNEEAGHGGHSGYEPHSFEDAT